MLIPPEQNESVVYFQHFTIIIRLLSEVTALLPVLDFLRRLLTICHGDISGDSILIR